MKNREYYEDKIHEIAYAHDVFAVDKTTGEMIRCGKMKCGNCLFNLLKEFPTCYTCSECARAWLEQEYTKPVLDDIEKRYLEGFIRPFKNRVVEITKRKLTDDYEYLSFYVKSLGDFETDSFDLPLFKCGAAYRGMKQDTRYTLNKLGLFASEEGDNEE